MSTLKIDGGWITLDDHRVARLVDDLPHWLMVELRDHEGSPETHHDEGYAAGRADAEAKSRRRGYGDD